MRAHHTVASSLGRSADCGYQSIPITHSTGFRSVIPVDSDHPRVERAAVLENLM